MTIRTHGIVRRLRVIDILDTFKCHADLHVLYPGFFFSKGEQRRSQFLLFPAFLAYNAGFDPLKLILATN